MLSLKGGVAKLLDARKRCSDVVARVARLLRWPVIYTALAAGAILSRPVHFGIPI